MIDHTSEALRKATEALETPGSGLFEFQYAGAWATIALAEQTYIANLMRYLEMHSDELPYEQRAAIRKALKRELGLG